MTEVSKKPIWLKSLTQYLMRRAPILLMDAYGQSRKVNDPGWSYASKEIRCFAAIHYYVARGLGDSLGPIAEVLGAIHDFQKYHERGPYDTHFYTFGFSSDTLRRKSKQLYPHTKMVELAKGICALSGTTMSETPCVIKGIRTPESEDLQVFLCNNQSVKLNLNFARTYGRVKERSAWFFFGKEPQWEPGTHFRPDLIEMTDVPDD